MKDREAFLDRLRIIATCTVVLLHTVTGVMDISDMSLYPAEKRVFLVALDLVCWCVPVFLMISGYLFLNPARRLDMKKMVTKYCRRIVLALFVFGVPYAWLEQVALAGGFRWNMIGEGVLMVLRGESWSHMWYLYLILLLYLLTPGMKWLLARVPRWTVYVLLGVLFVGSSLIPYLSRLLEMEWSLRLPDEGIYFFYYICGYLFVPGTEGKGKDCLADPGRKRKIGKWLSLLALLLAAGMACSRLIGNYALQMAYNYPFTVLLSLLLFGAGAFSGKCPSECGQKEAEGKKNRRKRLWRQAAELSFGVYLVHPLFLNLAYKFFHITPLSFSLGVSLPLFFLGTLLLAAATAWIMYRLPPLRKYVI